MTALAFSPDGQTIASGGDWRDPVLTLWDVATREPRTSLCGHLAQVTACAFSPDGQTIVTASGDRALKLWDPATGEEQTSLAGHSDWVRACAFSPDGRTIVSGSHDTTLKLWDAASGTERATLAGHTNWVNGCAFSPDSRTIVSASDDATLRLWDAASGAERVTLTGHAFAVDDCAFSPDGTTIVSASDDKTLKLWDTATGGERATLTGHAGHVRACAFSPDGTTIVSASEDKTLKLWDAETGAERATMTGHADGVHSCAFSPDGKTIVSATEDGTLKLWDVGSGAELATIMPAAARIRGEEKVPSVPDGTSQEPGQSDAAASEPQVLDEDVQFTVYRPKVVRPAVWYSLLAFIHKSTLVPREDGAPPLDPLEEVQHIAEQVLGEAARDYRDICQDAQQALVRGSELRIVPAVPGIEFDPPSRSVIWVEPVHHEEFRMRASADLDRRTARGVVSVYLGLLLIAEVTLSIRVDSSHVDQPGQEDRRVDQFRANRRIFVSYSHKDTDVVEWFEAVAAVVTVVTDDEFLRDVRILREGEDWEEPIMRKIGEADIFQLFWSWNAMESKFVQQEWEYALSLARPQFVRPVYWHEPLPQRPDEGLPPPELTRLLFRKLPGEVGAPHAGPPVTAEAVSQAPAATAEAATIVAAAGEAIAEEPAAEDVAEPVAEQPAVEGVAEEPAAAEVAEQPTVEAAAAEVAVLPSELGPPAPSSKEPTQYSWNPEAGGRMAFEAQRVSREHLPLWMIGLLIACGAGCIVGGYLLTTLTPWLWLVAVPLFILAVLIIFGALSTRRTP